MNKYQIDGQEIDSVELKCLVVSKGVKVENAVYKAFAGKTRLGKNPMMCNCFFLSDNSVVQLTDMAFHPEYMFGMLTFSNLKLLKYASQMATPFSIKLLDGQAALFWNKAFVDYVTFPPQNNFYFKKTEEGTKFIGNAVLQGVDWVAFQCLWHCEYAAAGKPCQFCFSGEEQRSLQARRKPQQAALSAKDAAEIVDYAINKCGCNSVQITGGSTFDGKKEYEHISRYLETIDERVGRKNLNGDVLLYITPPKELSFIDDYFAKGASRIACSLEVWDEGLAKQITPGKIEYTTRKRHLDALSYIAERFGAGKAFSNFIIGLEPYESLKEGATYLASRGIIPTASIWMPMGKPVNGSMQTPSVDFYRKVKELFAELYVKYKLEPSESCGLNVCMERDIWNFSQCGGKGEGGNACCGRH